MMQSLQVGRLCLEFGCRTYIVGILNVTPDSFAGDGVMDVEAALARGRALLAEGEWVATPGRRGTRVVDLE